MSGLSSSFSAEVVGFRTDKAEEVHNTFPAGMLDYSLDFLVNLWE